MTKVKQTTIRDVATVAEVSIATVSRVLNKSEVPSDEIRAKVERVVKELNYVPLKSGRKPKGGGRVPSMNGKSSSVRTIGLVISSSTLREYSQGELYYARLLNGIYQGASELEYRVVNCKSDSREPLPLLLAKGKWDGFLVIEHLSSAVQTLLAERAPVVFLDGAPKHIRAGSVRPDFESAVREALQCLWDVGHRNIAMFLAENDPVPNPPMIAAYQRFFAEKGGEILSPALNVPRNINSENHVQLLASYADELMQASPRPTAVISADVYACRISIELKRAGFSIPRDFSIVGFYDSMSASHLEPPLTSYRFPMDEIGKAAVEELIRAVEEPDKAPRQLSLEGEIVVRGSLAVPAAS